VCTHVLYTSQTPTKPALPPIPTSDRAPTRRGTAHTLYRRVARVADGREAVQDVLLARDLAVLGDDVAVDERVALLPDVDAVEDDDAVAVVAVRERLHVGRRVLGLGDGRREDLQDWQLEDAQEIRPRLKTHGREQADRSDHEEESLAEDHSGRSLEEMKKVSAAQP
jgi:hypothetical protein